MRAIATGAAGSRRQMGVAMKALTGKKHRMMKNHNVHVITHHGKVMVGRKGRKA